MFDPDRLPELKNLIREATRGDAGLLDEVMRDVALLGHSVTTIQPRNMNSISLVASDGGNNRIEFNPFSLQVVRVVDTFGDELFLDVISPSTDTVALGQRHLDDPWSPLGKMMRDLGASTLGELSTVIPAKPRSKGWPLVYRDLCEWAVLYDLICYERWGSDTLIVRDGLLRAKIFAEDQFVRLYRLMKAAIEKSQRERKRGIFLVGLAKHSRVIERYQLAMAVQDIFPAGRPGYTPVPPELQVKVYDWAEYVQSPEDDDTDKERPKFNMGAMFLVRFGRQSADPVWTADLLHFQAARAQQIFGSLLADAELGFPVPCYPHCLQEADRYAQVADLDLAILQGAMQEAVRDLIRADRRHVFDAQRLWPADPAALRYQ
ncbi:MAG: hypothetical protein M3Z75_12295 [Actinomycetota bacterium]|nr:hypothetical protein [Actinomycetota bacterium]